MQLWIVCDYPGLGSLSLCYGLVFMSFFSGLFMLASLFGGHTHFLICHHPMLHCVICWLHCCIFHVMESFGWLWKRNTIFCQNGSLPLISAKDWVESELGPCRATCNLACAKTASSFPYCKVDGWALLHAHGSNKFLKFSQYSTVKLLELGLVLLLVKLLPRARSYLFYLTIFPVPSIVGIRFAVR